MPLLFFIQAEHHAALEQAELRYQDQKKVLLDEQNKVKEELRQVYLDQQGIGNKIKLEQAQELSSVRKSMEQDVRKMEEKFQSRLETLRSELEKRRKVDVHDIEVNNQEHVRKLKESHERAIIDTKNCYNDIILNNMTLITTLKVRNQCAMSIENHSFMLYCMLRKTSPNIGKKKRG